MAASANVCQETDYLQALQHITGQLQECRYAQVRVVKGSVVSDQPLHCMTPTVLFVPATDHYFFHPTCGYELKPMQPIAVHIGRRWQLAGHCVPGLLLWPGACGLQKP